MASILLVDDDKNILLFLKEVLAKLGHDLTLANSGAEALEVMESNTYDLIVSDLQMPKVDGLQILKASKKKNPNTEVLILTGYGSIKSAVRAMKTGAFEYLSKPVDIEELRLKVGQALQHKEMRIKIEKQQQEINEFNKMIARDLNLAEQVQKSLVPQSIENKWIDVGVKYLPMIGVGGDYADIYFDGDKNIYLTIIDVTGHGITAALLVNRVCSELRKLIREHLSPREILFNLNNTIYDIFFRTGMFLTMFSCKIDLQKKYCTYAGSAHPAVVLWHHQQDAFNQLGSQNTIIGFEKKEKNQFIEDKVEIHTGDKLVLYTDGLIEIEDSHKRPIGLAGLLDSLRTCIHQSSLEIPEVIVSNLNNYTKHIRDDLFLIVAGIK